MPRRRDLSSRGGVGGDFIANGVVPVTMRPLHPAAAKFGLKEADFTSSAGPLMRGRNVHWVAAPFATIGTDKRLVVVGRAKLRAMAVGDTRGLLTKPPYSGIPDETCSGTYLFCLPSAHEGMSAALPVTLSYGAPVLVSDIDTDPGVTEDEVEPAGLAFATGSVESLRGCRDCEAKMDGGVDAVQKCQLRFSQ